MGSQGETGLGIEGVTDAVRVGQGSFGTVYRATQAAYGRTVAVKVLAAPLVDEQSRKAFDRECRALGTISDHPGIVTLHAAGVSADNHPYLIMEFLSGGSLADKLRAGPLPWADAVAIGIKVAGALATAHAAGVLHRDIKPENVLLSGYGEPELADFGVAKVQGGTHTSMGTITGSVAYAAPEVLSGLAATESSDVWSLASTVGTLLAGVSPFHRDGEQSLQPLLMRIITAEPNDLRPFGVPEDVYQVIMAALAKDTWERTQSAAEFGEALQQVQPGHGLPVTPMTVRRAPDGGATATPGPTPNPYSARISAPASGPATSPTPVAPFVPEDLGHPSPPAVDEARVSNPGTPHMAQVGPVGDESATQRRTAPVAEGAPPPAPRGPTGSLPLRAKRWRRKSKDAVNVPIPEARSGAASPVIPRSAGPPLVSPPDVASRPAAGWPGPQLAAVAAGEDDPTPHRPLGPESAGQRTSVRRRWLAGGLVAVATVIVVLVVLLAGSGKPHRAPAALPTSATVTTVRSAGGSPPTTPTTTPPVHPVFADDFSNPGSGWAPDTNQDGNGTATYMPDGYHVTALKPMPALNTFSVASPYQPRHLSLSSTVTATLTGAPSDGVGVRCDQGSRAHLRYTFEIRNDGTWVVFKIDDSGSAALLQGQAPNAIHTGAASNLITGTCAEIHVGATQLTMIVNGVTLGGVTDVHPGQIAWHAALVIYRATPAVATDVRFNSFQTIVDSS